LSKKEKRTEIALLTQALAHKKGRPHILLKKKKKSPTPQGGNVENLRPYQFKPGQSGNPGGNPKNYAIELAGRLSRSSPPEHLCKQLNLVPTVTWGEAILIVLSRTALDGDVAASREILAALGFHGTAAHNLLAVSVDNNPGGVTFEFLQHSHGLTEDQFAELWAFMDAMPREELTLDAASLPGDEYREGELAASVPEETV